MTNEEAIQNLIQISRMYGHKWQQEACAIAIEAIKRQIPKKVKYDEYGKEEGYPHCPTCGGTLINDFVGVAYCPNCGQNLDWEDEE